MSSLKMNDEILLGAVLVMLIASTYMGFAVQRSLYHSRKAFEALTKEITQITIANFHLDEEVERLKHRVAELEFGSGDAAQIRSRPRPLN
jgi:hypothetical protein